MKKSMPLANVFESTLPASLVPTVRVFFKPIVFRVDLTSAIFDVMVETAAM